MSTYHLHIPLIDQEIDQLEIGDEVYLYGKAFTCRSRLQRWVFDEGHPFPNSLRDNNVLIHAGPIVAIENDQWKLISFMPTSSIRFEKWGASTIKEWKLKMIVGKTTMGEQTMKMMVKNKCVHASPQSVSPNLWIKSIKVEGVDLFDQLGAIEAAWHLNLDGLGPFIVDIDCRGNNLYKNHEAIVNANREKVFEKLSIEQDFKFTKLY